MKAIFLALFVVAVTAAPLPDDSGSDAVEMVINGVPDGEPLDLSNVVDIKLNEHADGAVVATDLLHPYSAVGIAEAAAAAASAPDVNEVSVVHNDLARRPVPVAVDAPQVVEVEPVPVLVPELVVPEPIVMPAPAVPEVEVEPEHLPVAAPQYNGEVYNDGLVQVQYNGPESPGMLSTLQSWFNVFINYFNPPQNPATQIQPRQ